MPGPKCRLGLVVNRSNGRLLAAPLNPTRSAVRTVSVARLSGGHAGRSLRPRAHHDHYLEWL